MSTTTETITLTDMTVMTAKDFEDACKEPVVIATVVSMMTMLALNMIGMYVFFTKMDQMFNPNKLKADLRRQLFYKRHMSNK